MQIAKVHKNSQSLVSLVNQFPHLDYWTSQGVTLGQASSKTLMFLRSSMQARIFCLSPATFCHISHFDISIFFGDFSLVEQFSTTVNRLTSDTAHQATLNNMGT